MLLKTIFFVGLITQSSGLTDMAHTNEEKVVYGSDNREDICEATSDMFKHIARQSIAAMISSSFFATEMSDYSSVLNNADTLGDAYDLCSDQRFIDQPSPADCSGTLIAPDRILTVGHCLSDANCANMSWVFNYYLDGDNCALPAITPDDVYSCGRYTRYVEDSFDYGIVHLDRPVVGRRYVEVVKNGSIAVGDRVTIIGFGSGIPAKIDSGGYVISTNDDDKDIFQASTDAFGGNSGSGAFNDCGQLVGMLIGGLTDYITRGNCSIVNTVTCNTTECSGLDDAESVSYPYFALEEAPDCGSDDDCANLEDTPHCFRTCAPSNSSCTGFCVEDAQPTQTWPDEESPQPTLEPFPSFRPSGCVAQTNQTADDDDDDNTADDDDDNTADDDDDNNSSDSPSPVFLVAVIAPIVVMLGGSL